jgi:uncharacterized protein (TIGR00369 family)
LLARQEGHGYKGSMSDQPVDPKAAIKHFFGEKIPHQRELGMQILDVGTGWASGQVPYREDLIGNPFTRVIHGGVVTSLLDALGGVASASSAKFSSPLATLDLRIDYLRPSKPDQPVIGRVECFRVTRNVAFTRGIAHNGDESDPIASMTATYIFTSPRSEGGKKRSEQVSE